MQDDNKPDESHSEQRKFKRVRFENEANIVFGAQSWDTKLIDVSLNGALIDEPADWHGQTNDKGMLFIHLGNGIDRIIMRVHVAHMEHRRIGLTCDYIDIDSITHLKRLVELNAGEECLLERELSALIH